MPLLVMLKHEEGTSCEVILHNRQVPPDEGELALVFTAVAILPRFWAELALRPEPPAPWAVPLDFEDHELSGTVDLSALGALSDIFSDMSSSSRARAARFLNF